MPRLSLSLFLTLIVCWVSLEGTRAQAAFVVGGTGLMTQDHADKLQIWLGKGEIQLTNIYSKKSGDFASHFHSAVDGKGPTITLVELLETQTAIGYSSTWANGKTISLSQQVVGGYNPQSWLSNNFYQTASSSSNRAFLFNLTSNEQFVLRADAPGEIETFNFAHSGPTFGMGHDLSILGELNLGGFKGFSYGPNPLSGSHQSIVMTNDSDEASINQVSAVPIGRIEVYSISGVAAVPEPATMVLWGLGAIGLRVACRKMGRRSSMTPSS